MEIAEFYNHAKQIGVPSKTIAEYIITFVNDTKNGDALSFEEIMEFIKREFPNGYNEPKIHRFKELHESFSDEDIRSQVIRFRENATQWGFPDKLKDDIISEFLVNAKALDASSLDDFVALD